MRAGGYPPESCNAAGSYANARARATRCHATVLDLINKVIVVDLRERTGNAFDPKLVSALKAIDELEFNERVTDKSLELFTRQSAADPAGNLTWRPPRS